MNDRAVAAAVRILDQLCQEAVWDDGRAIWLGDERRDVAGTVEVVHASTDGSVYGGTAGIGLVLTRAWQQLGDDRYRDAARGALAHASTWLDRQRPSPSLYSGSLGVIAALAEAGMAFGDGTLLDEARFRAETAADAVTSGSFDVIGGLAGSVIVWLRLADLLAGERFLDLASTLGDRLVDGAEEFSVGLAWRDPAAGDEPALCGLAHGASGVAWALADLWRRTGSARAIDTAFAAMAYERAWYRRDEMNWPDLREIKRADLDKGDKTASPVYWCHGALGVGLVRLRVVELTGSTVAAAEAGAALLAAEREVLRASQESAPRDLSLCHGLAGAAELLLEGARVFGQGALAERAVEAADLVIDLGGDGAGPWPCGVAGGGENPSLMLGLAGIAGVLLRFGTQRRPLGLLYSEPMAATRLIVKLAGELDQQQLQARLEKLVEAVPAATVERVSRSGRAVLRLAPGTSIDEAVVAAQKLTGVEYAEADVTDRATDAH